MKQNNSVPHRARDRAARMARASTVDIPTDIVSFCESLQLGLEKFTFQEREFMREIMTDTTRMVTVLKSRQVGFTVAQAALMAYHALKTPGIGIMYCSYNLKHMRYISKSLLRRFLQSKVNMKKDEESIESYFLPNGSIITLISGTNAFAQAKGYRVDLLCVDEAEALQLEEMPIIQESMAASAINRCIIGGTGTSMGTEWEKLWKKTTQSIWDGRQWIPQGTGTHGYHLTQRMMPNWSQESEDQKRAQYSPLRFSTEVLGEFAAGTAEPLPLHVVRQCYQGVGWDSPQSGIDYIASIDLAAGGESDTVIAISSGDRLHYARNITDMLTSDIYPKIDQVLREWKPNVIVSDAGGNIELLHRIRQDYDVTAYRLGPQTEPIKYGGIDMPISKSFFVQKTIARFHNHTITLPDAEPWVVDHLTGDTAETIHKKEGGSYVRYSKMPNRQDDLLMALVFAEAASYSNIDDSNPHNKVGAVGVG